MIDTVYLEGSYLLQEPDLTDTVAKELCLTLESLQKAYRQGYKHVWIFGQAVRFKVPIPTSKISKSRSGCVVWCNTTVHPNSRLPEKQLVTDRIHEMLSFV